MSPQNLSDYLEKYFFANKNKTLFQIKRGFLRKRWTYEQSLEEIYKLNAFWHSKNIKKGDTILLWAPNMPEWSLVFLSSLWSGITFIPADPRSHFETVEHYIKQMNPKVLIVSKFLKPFVETKTSKTLILEEIFEGLEGKKGSTATSLDDIAEIVYTSGSSGDPKGVILTQKNIYSQIEQSLKILPTLNRYETVSVLPLSHIFEQIYGLLLPICKGGTINYIERVNPLTIRKELKLTRSTYLILVPQILRLFYERIENQAKERNKYSLFQNLTKVSPLLPMGLRKVIFRQVHQGFGGNLNFIGCGSAPLEPKLAKMWEALGFYIIEGYGATETTGMVSALPINNRKFGTVGRKGINCEVQLSDEGEILVRGDIISPGYFQNEEKTNETYKDGWYYTGDTGRLDRRGFLTITGRISSRIVLNDGTKVYPEDIERKLNNHSEIKDSCVVEKIIKGEAVVHAWLLVKEKNTNLETVIREVNHSLESKQQILSWDTWPNEDFPRLNNLKVDRREVAKLTQSHTKQELNVKQEVDLSNIDSLLKSLSGKAKISDEDTLGGELKFDSLRRIQLAALIEQYYGVQINELELTSDITISKFKDLVKHGTKSQSGFTAEDFLSRKTLSREAEVLRRLVQEVFFVLHNVFAPAIVVEGKEILQSIKQPSLLIFNHIGMFDFISVAKILPSKILNKTSIAVTSDRWEDGNTFVARLIELTLYGYPIAHTGPWLIAGLDITSEMVDRGYSIIYAPEGRMQRENQQQPFLPGLGLIVKEMQLPIYMFKLSENYRNIWPPPPPEKGALTKEYFVPRKRERVIIKVAKADIPESFDGSYQELTEYIEQQYRRL